MKATFDIPENKTAAFALAALLAFGTFSILPISLTGVETKKVPVEYTKVYAAEVGPEKPRPAESSEKISIRGFSPSQTTAVKNFSGDISADISVISDSPAKFSIGGADTEGIEFAQAGGQTFENPVFELSELDSIPKLLKSVRVKYPPKLFKRGISGEARLLVEIDENGSVKVLDVERCTNTLFAEAAKEAVSKFLYESPMKNGKKVRAQFILPVPFKISEIK